MADFLLMFEGGPCNGQLRTLAGISSPPETLNCGGVTYTLGPVIRDQATYLAPVGAASSAEPLTRAPRAWQGFLHAQFVSLPEALRRSRRSRLALRQLGRIPGGR